MISTDTLAQYQHDVRALRERVQQEADRDQQQELVERNLPLVMTLARRYQGRGIDLMDLIQEGNLGLLRAAHKFDPSLGVKFSTYAVFWIKQGMLSAFPQRIASVPASRYTFERAGRVQRVQREIQERTGHAPTLAQLAKATETTVATVLALLNVQQGMQTSSLDAQRGDNEEETLANLLEANPEQGPEHLTLLHSRNEQIERLLKLLTRAERQVILLRYGILDGEVQTYEGIATRMHLGLDKVHSLEQRALMKMRRYATLKHVHDFVE